MVLPDNRRVGIEFVIDTGFDGFLVIPVRAVIVLGLPFLYRLDANLADDRRRSTPVHGATIVWDGREKDIQVGLSLRVSRMRRWLAFVVPP